MITVLIIIVHVLVSTLMIGVILLQSGKGAEIGAAFGGSSQTIFGSRGAATVLSKMTIATATLLMLSSLPPGPRPAPPAPATRPPAEPRPAGGNPAAPNAPATP